MPRFILLFAVALLIGQTPFAQTPAQIDSLKAEFYKVLKNMPPPSDSEIRAHQPPPRVPDTVHFAHVHAYKPQALPTLFETAFFNLSSFKQDTMTFFFVAVDIGELNCETGRLIACDPIVMRGFPPFVQQFPVGRFPVQLSIAKYRQQERVAFSRIYFSEEPVVKWEFALDSGQQQRSIFSDTLSGYSVDGGIGIFIDAKANQAFTVLGRADDYVFERAFTDEMYKHDHGSWQYANYHFQEHNVVSFSTGFGDGRYGTFVGYDKDGKICRLLTDFGLFDWWKN
jgi:hypothetical protein